MIAKDINLDIYQIEEYQLSGLEHFKINQLLQQAFIGYPPNKSYYNQAPTFRLLAYEGEQLIGHLGASYRNITLNRQLLPVLGISDLCVDVRFQSQKIASRLLGQLELFAKKTAVEFLVLIAEQHDIYLDNGFKLVNNRGKWLIIKQEMSLGIAHKKLNNCLMIKSIKGKKWETGTVDFLGTMF